MNRESRVEGSIPVQSRVSIQDLATILIMWEEEGILVKSLSQLIAWSMSVLADRVRAIGRRDEISIAEAHRMIEQRGLYQKSLKKRSMKKIATAMGFESLRDEGVDPSWVAPRQYKTLHNVKSVEGAPQDTMGAMKENIFSDHDLQRIEEERKKEIERLTEESVGKLDIEELRKGAIED